MGRIHCTPRVMYNYTVYYFLFIEMTKYKFKTRTFALNIIQRSMSLSQAHTYFSNSKFKNRLNIFTSLQSVYDLSFNTLTITEHYETTVNKLTQVKISRSHPVVILVLPVLFLWYCIKMKFWHQKWILHTWIHQFGGITHHSRMNGSKPILSRWRLGAILGSGQLRELPKVATLATKLKWLV